MDRCRGNRSTAAEQDQARSRPACAEPLAPHPFSLDRPSRVDVIVCVKDQLDVTRPCLESVIRCSTVPMRLIVVDDGSRRETRAFLESLAFPNVSLHRNPRTLGYTRAANVGLALGSSPYRVLLNSDTQVTRGWLERLLRCMEASPDTAIVGPVSNRASYQSVPRVVEGGGWAPNPLSVELGAWSEVVAALAARAYPEVPNVTGMCWMVRADALKALGAFDESFSPEGYGEENEFARRAEAAGFRCRIADDCYVFHHGGRSFGSRTRQLEAQAHRRYLDRFGAAEVAALEKRLIAVPALDGLRERLIAVTEGESQPAVLFLLPSLGHFGGVIQVLDNARCLRRLGLPVTVAAPQRDRHLAHERDLPLLRFYQGEEDLSALAASFAAVVATHHVTVPLQNRILERHPGVVPFYFVQDYEPTFYPPGSAMHAAALRSYRSSARNCVAVSRWVIERLALEHGIPVEKVSGGIDLDIFDPSRSRPIEEHKLKVAAMIRPQTPWRAPRRTLEVFEELDRRHPGRLRFVTFGCEAGELAALSPQVALEHHGVAAPEWIFGLLRNVDLFLDLSDHQAFGRTALEAMAAGCVVLVPEEGGTADFARHRENALVCNSFDIDAVVDLVGEVIDDVALRDRLRRAALATALDHGATKGALEQYAFFRRRIEEVRNLRRERMPVRPSELDPAAEDAARTATNAHFAALGDRDLSRHVDQLMDVEAALGRFLYLRSVAPPDSLRAGAAVLVSGFAIGSEMIAARRMGFGRIAGVEVDPELVAICAARLRGLGDVQPMLYDGETLPFEDGAFSVVASGHVVEHTRDPQRYLGECLRVIEAGGLLSLEFPTRFHAVELHTGLPSFEWLPRRARDLALTLLSGPLSPLPERARQGYRSIVERGLQQISLGAVRRLLARTPFDWRLVHAVAAAPGIVRCVVQRRD